MANINADGYVAEQALVAVQEDVSKDFTVTLAGAEPQEGDTITLCRIPKGAIVMEWWLDIPSLNGAKFELGDTTEEVNTTGQPSAIPPAIAGDPDRYVVSDGLVAGTRPSSSCQASLPVANSLPFTYLGDSTLILTATTASSDQSTGVIRGYLRYNMRGNVF